MCQSSEVFSAEEAENIEKKLNDVSPEFQSEFGQSECHEESCCFRTGRKINPFGKSLKEVFGEL